MPHSIANKIVKAQLSALIDRAELPEILRQVNIDLDALERQQAVLNADTFATLMRTCFDVFDDEAMGFTEKPLRTGTFKMMCLATIGAPNLRRVIHRINEYFRLLSDEFQFSLEQEGEEASLVIRHKTSQNSDYFVGMLYVIFWRYLAWLMDAPLLLHRVAFAFPASGLEKDASSLYACPVFYGQPQNCMVFSSQYLNRQVRQTAEGLQQFLADAPECLLSRYEPDDSYSHQIKQLLSQELESETMTLEKVAEHFSCSSQSLSRRLRQEGHQFQQLKDKVRKAKTVHLLLNTDLSISDISRKLGFAEDTVFYRTFKKWTGLTPKQDRQRNHSK